jgi:DNA-binding beta-propeller fold protein YncE
MAPTHQSRLFVFAAGSLAALTILWSSHSEPLSANTRSFGNERLVSRTPLTDANGEACEMPPENTTGLGVASSASEAGFQRRGGGAAAVAGGTAITKQPDRIIRDRFPAFSSIAVDTIRDQIVVTDENLFQVLFYSRTENNRPNQVAKPIRLVGTPWDAAMLHREEPKTKIEFQCGLYFDPSNGEVYAVNNDTQDTLVIFSNEQTGNVAPTRDVHTPHGTFGITVDEATQEMFLTVQHDSAVVVYKKSAKGEERPIRLLQGDRTRLADPHGVAFDSKTNLIFVTNHGSVHKVRREEGQDGRNIRRGAALPNWPLERDFAVPGSGQTLPPAITVYAHDAAGDTAPLRVIEGPRTQLNWPTGIVIDSERGEIYVTNDTADAILVFDVAASGDVAPRRVLRGAKTGLKNPTGIALDKKNGEMWIANFGNHTATAYKLDAQGDTAPLRTVRAAPGGTPSLMIGNPGAMAYDPKREQLLVPN